MSTNVAWTVSPGFNTCGRETPKRYSPQNGHGYEQHFQEAGLESAHLGVNTAGNSERIVARLWAPRRTAVLLKPLSTAVGWPA